MDIHVHRTDHAHDLAVVVASCPEGLPLHGTVGQIDHLKKILPRKRPADEVQAVDVERDLRLTVRLDVIVHPHRNDTDSRNLASVHVFSGSRERIVVDNLSQLGGIQLLAEIP